MNIPLPCKFGELATCDGQMLQLKGVTWFQWSCGMEYTYFFSYPDKWHNTKFYSTFEPNHTCEFVIPDGLLADRRIKEHGYPLKGNGYAHGVFYLEGKTYIDFIMSSCYFAHIKVQCDEKGEYVPYGNIIFPTSWDTEERRQSAILKKYQTTKDISQKESFTG